MLVDERAVERALGVFTLGLPRTPQRGRLGEVRSQSVGSSMELHDFRIYQPGDDLRQLDWNAVARTGELVLRIRQDEVSPRFELVLDGSRSMALTEAKAARARELALLLIRAAARVGLEPSVVSTGVRPERQTAVAAESACRRVAFDGQDALAEAVRRAPPLRPCGLRVVLSDFLYETDFDRHFRKFAVGASAVAFVQLLTPEEEAPAGGYGAKLTDVESGEALERILTQDVLDAYLQRLAAHQKVVAVAAQRCRGRLVRASSAHPIDVLARGALAPLTLREGWA